MARATVRPLTTALLQLMRSERRGATPACADTGVRVRAAGEGADEDADRWAVPAVRGRGGALVSPGTDCAAHRSHRARSSSSATIFVHSEYSALSCPGGREHARFRTRTDRPAALLSATHNSGGLDYERGKPGFSQQCAQLADARRSSRVEKGELVSARNCPCARRVGPVRVRPMQHTTTSIRRMSSAYNAQHTTESMQRTPATLDATRHSTRNAWSTTRTMQRAAVRPRLAAWRPDFLN